MGHPRPRFSRRGGHRSWPEGEGEADAAGVFLDAQRDLQEPQLDGGELGSGQIADGGNGIAQGEHQPVGGSVEDETDLIGDGPAAGGRIRGKLGLVRLDQVLGLASGTIDRGFR